MNKIFYDERAKFYDKEVSIDPTKASFFQKVKKEFNINKTLYCPCASGIYLDTFSDIFDKSYFIDINSNMINQLSKKISDKRIDNVLTFVMDIQNVDNIKGNIDCIFVLDQAIQYIDYINFEKFLFKASAISKYIVLDIFDFRKEGMLSYFNSNIPNNEIYKSKEFELSDKKITRYNSHRLKKDKITFQYFYKTNSKKEFTTSFTLNNYSFDFTMKIIKRTKLYKIKKILKNYSMNDYDNEGQFILVLEKL